MNGSKRIDDIERLYDLLDELARRTHPLQPLSACLKPNVKSEPGVYFFYECGECRLQSGKGARIVRVGQSTNLRRRLRNHKSGNKVRSIFCKLVGHALKKKKEDEQWQSTSTAQKSLNERVTETLGNMQVLCLPIEDETERDCIERNAIALLSNYCRCPTDCQCPTDRQCPTNWQCPTNCWCPTNCECPIDPPSKNWLGHHHIQEKVRRSGLWSQDHVKDIYDSRFLDTLEDLIINL